MSIRCGCPDEADDIVFGPSHRCSKPIPDPLPRPTRWSDLFGIDPDYTEGLPIDEWLERNRGTAELRYMGTLDEDERCGY
jgi:hypothetical protein